MTKEEAKLFVKNLKLIYRNPSAWGAGEYEYSVGHSICPEKRFPNFLEIAEALGRLNPQLRMWDRWMLSTQNIKMAYAINSENFKGNLARAWDILEEALSWNGEISHEQ